jgi:hypothetical protein
MIGGDWTQTPSPASPVRRMSAIAVIAWAILPIQVVICGAAFAVINTVLYFVEGVWDGFGTIVGACLFAAVVTILAVALGLPLRLVPVLRDWWFRSGSLTVVAVVVGLGLLALSFLVPDAHHAEIELEPGLRVHAFFGDTALGLAGQAITAFGLAHLWFPRSLARLVPLRWRNSFTRVGSART